MKHIAPLLALCAVSASAAIVPGLEDYGSVTLVDSIDCANDTTHRFREHPSGGSYVTNILNVSTRVMHHDASTCSYVSWRVGEGKGIVPNDPYILVVDYPDEAPRSVTLFNFGNATRHGYHTGFTVGDSMSPPYVTQSLESWAVPFSGETKQLIQVMVPFEKSKQYNGSDDRIPMATDGFDVNFGLIKDTEAGAWYVAFACDTLSADYSNWKCRSCSQAESTEVELPADTQQEKSLFFMIFRASGEIPLDTPLSDFISKE